MGANVDAGSMTIGSPPDSWVARHADDPVRAPWDDNLSLIRDYPSRVGYIELRVHLKPGGSRRSGQGRRGRSPVRPRAQDRRDA